MFSGVPHLFSFTCTTFVKQCLIEETCSKPFLFWIGLVMFFNLMNLDAKYGCGHFGSRFSTGCDLFGFHPCSLPTLLGSGIDLFNFDLAQYLPYTMKRTATAAFAPQPQETLPSVSNYLSLYVALNPTQFAQFQDC